MRRAQGAAPNLLFKYCAYRNILLDFYARLAPFAMPQGTPARPLAALPVRASSNSARRLPRVLTSACITLLHTAYLFFHRFIHPRQP